MESEVIYIDDAGLALKYETIGIFSRIIDSLPEDSMRRGYELGISDSEINNFIFSRIDDLKINKKIADAQKRSRLFGGALMVMFLDDGNSLESPLSLENLHNFADLRVYDRTEAIPDFASVYLFNQEQPWKTGDPEFYDITTNRGGRFRVHESRCITFKNGELMSYSQYQQYQFWGLPEYYRVAKPLGNYIKAHEMSLKMLERSVQPIFKTDMVSILSAENGEAKMKKRLGWISKFFNRDKYIGIDKETEDIEFAHAPLHGLQEVVRASMDDLAAASRHPQTKLFGTSPGGLQSTGESDTKFWHSEVESNQELNLKAPLLLLIDLIIQEGLFKGKIAERPEVNFVFNSLEVLSDLEEMQIKLQEMQVARQKAEIADMYCEMGVLDPSEIRKGLSEDNEYQIEDLLSLQDATPMLSRLRDFK